MRKVIEGAGMTAQEITYPDTPEEKKAAKLAAIEAWRIAGNSFEIGVSPIETWARGQLAAFGLKDLAALTEKDPPFGDSLGDRSLRYAGQVLRYIEIVRKEITGDNAPAAARFGIKIGQLFEQIQTALVWEPAAIAHVRVQEGAKRGGDIRGRQQKLEKSEKHDVAVVRGRGNVSSIVMELALRKDEMGDYLRPKDELWPALIGQLDILLLSPKEVVDDSRNPIRIDYCDEDEKTGQIKFAAFKTMVSTARKKVK